MTSLINQALLDTIVEAAKTAPRRRSNLNFHPDNTYPAHRLLIAIEPDSYVVPHCHYSPAKDETLLVVRGSLGVVLFAPDGVIAQATRLGAGGESIGIDIPHGVFHSVVALESNTVFFEAKAGPYVPVAPDELGAWAPREGSVEAPDYLRQLRALFK